MAVWLDTAPPHFVNRGLCRPLLRPDLMVPTADFADKSRTHSSAGERSLHTGEVQGSIPCASTIKPSDFLQFLDCLPSRFGNSGQNETRNRRFDLWKIRGLCSRAVPIDNNLIQVAA